MFCSRRRFIPLHRSSPFTFLLSHSRTIVRQFIEVNFASFLSGEFITATVQVNLCQKLLFLYQLTHNMTTDCSLNYKLNTWKFQAQTWGEHVGNPTCCVQKLLWMSETISVHNMFSPGLSLEYSCIELVIQWTICRHIVG